MFLTLTYGKSNSLKKTLNPLKGHKRCPLKVHTNLNKPAADSSGLFKYL